MLLFVKGHYLPLIASGAKTTTIRPWRTCTLKPGGVLSFNGRLRVVLTHVGQRRLDALTLADCQADGFPTRTAFLDAFALLYPALRADALVWILRFNPPNDSPHSARATA